MVETNINFNGNDNSIKSICWILSVVSWVVLIITEIIGLSKLSDEYIIWTFYRIPITKTYYYPLDAADNEMGFYPVQLNQAFTYIVFIILFCFTIIAFFYYMYKSTCNKDNSIFESMIGDWSKYHFIPLIIASILFIIGESSTKDSNRKDRNICGLIFVILGLISLIFVYIKTNLPPEWLPATIKKGVYSCLIALEWYYFCYDICSLKINNTSLFEKNFHKQIKAFSGFFSVFIGIGGLFFAIFFKDIIVAILHFLIYLGCTIFFFSIDANIRDLYNKAFDGVIDIFMMIFFLLEIAFVLIKYKTECLN